MGLAIATRLRRRGWIAPGATRLVQQIPRLLPAVEGVVPGRRRPVGQHRKGLVAGATTAPPNPDLLVAFVVRIFEALSVTEDGPLAANRAQPGEQFQRDLGHPGSVLFSGSGSAIKRITAGVKAGPLTVAAKFRSGDPPSPFR